MTNALTKRLHSFQFVSMNISIRYFTVPTFFEKAVKGIRIHDRKVISYLRNRQTDEVVGYITEKIIGTGSLGNALQYEYACYVDKEILLDLIICE